MADTASAIDKNINKMSNMVSSADVEKLGSALKEVKSEITHRAHELNDQAKMAVRKVNKSMHANPEYFMAGAAVVGLIAGLLLARRSRH